MVASLEKFTLPLWISAILATVVNTCRKWQCPQVTTSIRSSYLSLLSVPADVGPKASDEHGDHQVQLGIRPRKGKLMGDEAALGEASGDQEVPQLGLGLPGDPQDGHVQPLAVAVAHLLLLSCLSGILPSL